MRTKLFIITIFSVLNGFSQSGKILGVIVDSENNKIPFAAVSINTINKVFYSNNEGFFSTNKLKYGEYKIEFQSIT